MDWKWVGHGEWAFTNWNSGNPDNKDGGREDCVNVNIGLTYKDKWNDDTCSETLSYACEKNV